MNPLNKIFLGCGAAVIVIIALGFGGLILANAHLKTELAQVQANATACRMANDEFAAQVTRQDAAVAALKAVGAARAVQARLAAIKAHQQMQHALAAARTIGAGGGGGDRCRAAADLFDHTLGK